jgi:hypothetical protein
MSEGVNPRRFTQEAIVKALYEKLPLGSEVSLIAIKDRASILFQNEPKTDETTPTFNHLVDHSAAKGTTDFYGSLGQAKKVIDESSVPTSSTAVIICSDGEDNVSGLSAKDADTQLKVLIDDLAKGSSGIPAGTFVCFNNPKNSVDQLHVANMRSLGHRFKQPVITVADGPLQESVVKSVVDELLDIIPAVNAMHVYMEPFETLGNEVKRSFDDGSEAKYLGLISPGSTKMGQPLLARLSAFETTPNPRFLLLQGEVRYEFTTSVVEMTDPSEVDDLLYAVARNLLEYQLSHYPRPTELSRSIIDTTIRPLIYSLMIGPRTDALEGEIGFYLDQNEPLTVTARAQEFVGDVPDLTLADLARAGEGSSNLNFKRTSGECLSLHIPVSASVLEVKQVLQSSSYLGVPADQIKILCKGSVMPNNGDFREAASETVIHLMLRTPAQVEEGRKAQAAEEEATRVSCGWTADPLHPKTISVILRGGEHLAVDILSGTTVDQLFDKIRGLKSIDPEAFLISLHDRHGGPAFRKTATVASLPGALTEGFVCNILPKPAVQSLYSFVVSLNAKGEKFSVSISGSSEPTVATLKQAIGEKLSAKGFRVTDPLREIDLVIAGQVVRDSTLAFTDVPGILEATSVHVVHRCTRITSSDTDLVVVTRDGALPTASRRDPRATSTLNLILAGGETVEIQAERDSSLLSILLGALGIRDPKDLPLDMILRAVTTRMSSELDLHSTLAALRIGSNATLIIEGSHPLAAMREFIPTVQVRDFPLPRGADGRLLALMDDDTRTASSGATMAGGGSAGAGGPGSSQDALILAFVAEFRRQYAEVTGRVRMTFGARFLTALSKLSSDQDRYAEIRAHANSEPTSTTATAVRSLLCQEKYKDLKPDFSV